MSTEKNSKKFYSDPKKCMILGTVSGVERAELAKINNLFDNLTTNPSSPQPLMQLGVWKKKAQIHKCALNIGRQPQALEP